MRQGPATEVSDGGRRIQIANDLAIDVAESFRSARVIDMLSKLISVYGAPRCLRSDNGPELFSSALLECIVFEHIVWAFNGPSKP